MIGFAQGKGEDKVFLYWANDSLFRGVKRIITKS